MSKRPNVASAREKREERAIQKTHRKRKKTMKASATKTAAKQRKSGKGPKKVEPVVYSYSRGPVEMPKKVEAWLAQEVKDQEKHYRRIYKEIDSLEEERNQWAKEFFQRISGPRGFSVDGGQRRTLEKSELPKKPRRHWRLVW